jgi:cytochrome c6
MNTRWMCSRVPMIVLICFAVVSLLTPEARSQSGGEALYKTKCAACHGPAGDGSTAIGKTNKLRDFSSADVQKQTDDELTGIITNGRGKMPAYGKSLKQDQIKDLVAYLRTFKK